MTWNSDTADVNLLIDNVNQEIRQLEYGVASREILSRDGYGGLIKICDDQMFRERGFIMEYAPQSQPSPGTSSVVNTGKGEGVCKPKNKTWTQRLTNGTGSGPSDMDALSDNSFHGASGGSEPTVEDIHEPHIIQQVKTPRADASHSEEVAMASSKSLPTELGGNVAERDMTPPVFQMSSTMPRHTKKPSLDIGNQPIRTSARSLVDSSKSKEHVEKKKSQVEKWHAHLEYLRSGRVPVEQRTIRAALIADQAFRAAASHLKSGHCAEAVQLAEIAAGACPADKLTARDKINRLKQVAIRRLQLS